MKSCVVDASVVATAIFQEQHSEEAHDLLTSGATLFAPDLIHCELANVIWKRQQRKEITGEEATELLDDILTLPLHIVPSADLVEAALTLAISTRRTVYDCTYIALAMREDVSLVTSDLRLVNALAKGPLEDYVTLLGAAR
jgi:predicted nucleic acid-binding protein